MAVEEGEIFEESVAVEEGEQPVGEAIVDNEETDKNISVANSSSISVACRPYESESYVPVEVIIKWNLTYFIYIMTFLSFS